jgi:hypothetical protein
MTQPAAMPPARRRPIPGMTSHPSRARPQPTPDTTAGGREVTTDASDLVPLPRLRPAVAGKPEPAEPMMLADLSTLAGIEWPADAEDRQREPGVEALAEKLADALVAQRRPSADYAATRLVNFRLPVDLHDRFRRLVREAEERHPRLRRPSFTELVIALLEEGPSTADEVAEAIRRKRAGEHEAQP